MPAVKRITIEAVTDKRIDISLADSIKEPKNPDTKKAPNEMPRPPRWGILISWELLSFGVAVKFFILLIYTIKGKDLYESKNENKRITNENNKRFSLKKSDKPYIIVLNVY